jgi:hypothetical protein
MNRIDRAARRNKVKLGSAPHKIGHKAINKKIMAETRSVKQTKLKNILK